jgi:uncharacterized protein YgbK (DUF1537 family)
MKAVKSRSNILLAFYGDDFTGSTDALEFMSRAGAKTVLFIEPPTAKQLARYPQLDAFGVAGMTRAQSPEEMEQTLLPAFKALKKSAARHVHYKICSTFDSSPVIGSIGKAIDTGVAVFKNKFVPLLVATPALGRYCLFGNLFARMGIGSEGAIHRLDRHPSMSKHPVTPADESDLRLHLSKQTSKKTGLLDVLQLTKNKKEINTAINKIVKDGAEIILIDGLSDEHLAIIGELIDELADKSTQFSVGSSGIEMALGQYWNYKKVLQPVKEWPHPGKASSMLVVSGSCSPVTEAQIQWAKKNGFEEVILDIEALEKDEKKTMGPVIWEVATLLAKEKNVVLHSNGSSSGKKAANVSAQLIGTALGEITKEVAEQSPFSRLIIAGGDTSSYAARAMGIEAVEMLAALVPGAPLCKAIAPGSSVDGKELNFKGGQVGPENYFEIVLNGEI